MKPISRRSTFDVLSNQQWDRLQESHAPDIVVTWPDGHETGGINKHIEDLKALFVYAPDISIKVHPIRFGSGGWTAVTGVMTGIFTRPMPLGDGTGIPPTQKRFAIGDVDDWPLGQRAHGSRMVVLGWRRLHEAAWPRQVRPCVPSHLTWH